MFRTDTYQIICKWPAKTSLFHPNINLMLDLRRFYLYKEWKLLLNEKKSVSVAFKPSPEPFMQEDDVYMGSLYGVKALLAEDI